MRHGCPQRDAPCLDSVSGCRLPYEKEREKFGEGWGEEEEEKERDGVVTECGAPVYGTKLGEGQFGDIDSF